MTNRQPNKIAGWIGNVLLLAGAIAVAVSAGSFLGMTVWQKWQSHEFDRQRTAPQITTQPRSQPRIKTGDIVGRLAIPRLNVRVMVREGTDGRTLSLALGHIPGTALPGQPGNIGVAGHRDTLFRSLRNIAANDEITFETPRATYVYRVKTTQIVKPDDVQVLDPGPTRELTLVTCYPFRYVGAAPDRFIVKAQLIQQGAGIVAATIHPKPQTKPQIAFDVPQGHSRELVPGKVWFGLSSADPADRTIAGWIWVMPERQTLWLRDVDARQPFVFYQNGSKRELVIASVAHNSAKIYLR